MLLRLNSGGRLTFRSPCQQAVPSAMATESGLPCSVVTTLRVLCQCGCQGRVRSVDPAARCVWLTPRQQHVCVHRPATAGRSDGSRRGAAPATGHPGAGTVRESSCGGGDESLFRFVSGWCCFFPWLFGAKYIKSRNVQARVLGTASLVFAVIVFFVGALMLFHARLRHIQTAHVHGVFDNN